MATDHNTCHDDDRPNYNDINNNPNYTNNTNIIITSIMIAVALGQRMAM